MLTNHKPWGQDETRNQVSIRAVYAKLKGADYFALALVTRTPRTSKSRRTCERFRNHDGYPRAECGNDGPSGSLWDPAVGSRERGIGN